MSHAYEVFVAVQVMFAEDGTVVGIAADNPTGGLHSQAEEDIWSVEYDDWIDVTEAFPAKGESVMFDARAEVGWAIARGQHPSVTEPEPQVMTTPDGADLAYRRLLARTEFGGEA